MGMRQLAWKVYPRPVKVFEVLNQNARLAQWIATHGGAPRFSRRDELFAHLAREIGPTPVDYLEFGVYRGASILWWAEHNAHPDSRFFGFDSFEGLPEDWELGRGGLKRGDLSTGGAIPATDDVRVAFVKGWYQQTLPQFLQTFEPIGRLVVHLDSDLYSSTLYALTSLNPLLAPGSILMFDEFCNHEEFRAFNDYVGAYTRDYRAVGTAQSSYKNVAVELL